MTIEFIGVTQFCYVTARIPYSDLICTQFSAVDSLARRSVFRICDTYQVNCHTSKGHFEGIIFHHRGTQFRVWVLGFWGFRVKGVPAIGLLRAILRASSSIEDSI